MDRRLVLFLTLSAAVLIGHFWLMQLLAPNRGRPVAKNPAAQQAGKQDAADKGKKADDPNVAAAEDKKPEDAEKLPAPEEQP
ncbi:MAG: hypothetical protein ACOY3P_24265, partial [Planctomycetota bacterium]